MLTYLDAVDRAYVRLPNGDLARLTKVGRDLRARATSLSSGRHWRGSVDELVRVEL